MKVNMNELRKSVHKLITLPMRSLTYTEIYNQVRGDTWFTYGRPSTAALPARHHFNYALCWLGIQRKSRHGVTYFHSPPGICQKNAIHSSKSIELICLVFFKPSGSFRASVGFPNPISKQRNWQSSHQSGILFPFYGEIKTFSNKIKTWQYWG